MRATCDYTADIPACFDSIQMRLVGSARKQAELLVSNYYRVAPREWRRMPYEVRTLRALQSSELSDHALAQTVCYEFRKQVGQQILEQGDLYRICLHDHRILCAADRVNVRLGALLTYVLTYELVHVVRFGQRLQAVDLPDSLRQDEERRVHRATRSILAAIADHEMNRVLSSGLANAHWAGLA